MNSEEYGYLSDNDTSDERINPIAWAMVKIINGPNGKAALGVILLLSVGTVGAYIIGGRYGLFPPIGDIVSCLTESIAA